MIMKYLLAALLSFGVGLDTYDPIYVFHPDYIEIGRSEKKVNVRIEIYKNKFRVINEKEDTEVYQIEMKLATKYGIALLGEGFWIEIHCRNLNDIEKIIIKGKEGEIRFTKKLFYAKQ